MEITGKSETRSVAQSRSNGTAPVCNCQLASLPGMAEITLGERILHPFKLLKRIFKRRWRYIMKAVDMRDTCCVRDMSPVAGCVATPLQPGDTVRVKSWEQIAATLDSWNQLQKCAFMEEMLKYCGTTQRVLKRVECFLDERDYRIKRCRGIVVLQDVMCCGTRDFGKCDRSCFFFWREEWLEKRCPEEIFVPLDDNGDKPGEVEGLNRNGDSSPIP